MHRIDRAKYKERDTDIYMLGMDTAAGSTDIRHLGTQFRHPGESERRTWVRDTDIIPD